MSAIHERIEGATPHQIGGTVTMSGENAHIRNHNEQGTAAGTGLSHGSGVDIRGGEFYMSAGYITSNRTEAADRPGGVNVEGTGVFNMTGTTTIGGIWVALTSSLVANNVAITKNEAEEMGGGIFTENHEYAINLNMLAVPAPYSNLTIQNMTFLDNSANLAWAPPINALATGIPAGSQSIYTHPLNNYDINFQLDSNIIEFQFTKTNNIVTPATGEPVPGAVFQLYSWDTVGDIWVASSTPVISDANGLVTLNLSITGQYRLVEVIPPAGLCRYLVINRRYKYCINNNLVDMRNLGAEIFTIANITKTLPANLQK
ncbi:MAG: prealbumin-like fold domain-containing protein [Defluviitaleaceae bacterium]|nr:prealbumin-like fold domain-containing protein [Defluviitaleaceae bacterium]